MTKTHEEFLEGFKDNLKHHLAAYETWKVKYEKMEKIELAYFQEIRIKLVNYFIDKIEQFEAEQKQVKDERTI